MNRADHRVVGSAVRAHLARLYPFCGPEELDELVERLCAGVGVDAAAPHHRRAALPDADEVVLITYADTVHADAEPPLQTLAQLCRGPFADVCSTVHVLPFYPSTSDGGFSVVDHRAVAADLGTWADVQALAQQQQLMVDVVCNHGSAGSERFREFIDGVEPGRSWFISMPAETDVSSVVRPRTHDLLRPVQTADGLRHVWATFSHDQIDFDFTNPDVLVDFVEVIGLYLDQGATRLRLDAIAYLWKQLGTPCIHLEQTHEVVKLFRTLVSARDARAMIITETNVPHEANVAYFGDSDEAHLVYNFTLAPLLVWSALAEDPSRLVAWLQNVPSPPPGNSFLNFIASHDGIGLRPVEGILSVEDLQPLIDRAESVGGAWSAYSTADGPRPYELNVSLADLLLGRDPSDASGDAVAVGPFIAAHAVLLALQGVPAIYIHSLLATPGDLAAVERSGHKRDINRPRLSRATVEERLRGGRSGRVFADLNRLIGRRRRQPAFAPAASQKVSVVDGTLLVIERTAATQRLVAVTNLSSASRQVRQQHAWPHRDLLATDPGDDGSTFAPWQTRWFTDD